MSDQDRDEALLLQRFLSLPVAKRRKLLERADKVDDTAVAPIELVTDVWTVIVGWCKNDLSKSAALARVCKMLRALVGDLAQSTPTTVKERLRVYMYRLASDDLYRFNSVTLPHAWRTANAACWTIACDNYKLPDWFRYRRTEEAITETKVDIAVAVTGHKPVEWTTYGQHTVHVRSGVMYSQSDRPLATIFDAEPEHIRKNRCLFLCVNGCTKDLVAAAKIVDTREKERSKKIPLLQRYLIADLKVTIFDTLIEEIKAVLTSVPVNQRPSPWDATINVACVHMADLQRAEEHVLRLIKERIRPLAPPTPNPL